jgi:hypothetical protein
MGGTFVQRHGVVFLQFVEPSATFGVADEIEEPAEQT